MATDHKTADEPGVCGCCAMPYPAGVGLHLEFGYWVVDRAEHPMPKLAPVKRKWRLHL